MKESPGVKYRWWITGLVFAVASLWIGAGVAGPGLTWDEPAYRYSQVRLEQWWNEIAGGASFADKLRAFSGDTIDFYWEFNRHGPNFHPPLASYLNMTSHAAFGPWMDDLSSRRLASSFELAATAAMLCHFLGRRYGTFAGVFAALSLVTTPRMLGDAHIMGTDIPMTLFWTGVAFAFWNALDSRAWQWALGVFWGCLFLVKFNGTAVAIPISIAFVAHAARTLTPTMFVRWLLWSALVFVPILPLAVAILAGRPSNQGEPLPLHLILDNSRFWSVLFLWPLLVVVFHSLRKRPERWPVGLETPWVVMAAAPLVAIALNPTWWHDPLTGLADYFELNFGRKGHLPDIGIYYLGKQYVYSLPWHNAWVLMAVTIPFGTLALGLLGVAMAIARWKKDLLGVYLLLHALTLPVVRMFPVPAHDGVRLFLPTFVFWAALAGLAAAAIASRWRHALLVAALVAVGPGWSIAECLRFHPYELSYYNIGLSAARAFGFEVTYWYDAVTPRVLGDLNRRLPPGALLAFPSRSINPEVFGENQSQGRFRNDIVLDSSGTKGFPFMLLLTHSSKATPFSRLLYAMQPWYHSDFEGVRLFSVVDPDRVAVAWALYSMTMKFDRQQDGRSHDVLDRSILEIDGDSLRRAAELLAEHGTGEFAIPAGAPAEVVELARRWAHDPNMARVIAVDPQAVRIAAEILVRWPADVRAVLESEGYPPESRFGGLFAPDERKRAVVPSP